VITTVKEAVDNALDACEEAEVLPDIEIAVRRTGPETFRIAVEDNGPGIVPENVPYVFGKLLYGSRFHQIRQSRGQQGIGISAAVLYAQLTTGLPTVVTTRTGAREPAHRFELRIRVETNEPEILSHEEVEWDRTHGTRVEIEFRASLAAKKRLVEYLRYTGVVNPHARLRADIDGEAFVSERVVDEPLVPPKAIKPHPLGIELGQLARMVSGTKGTLAPFLVDQFVRVGAKTADEICAAAELAPSAKVETLSGADVSRLLAALQSVRVPPPPTTQCLSPIGEELLIRGLSAEYRMDFVAARTRPSAVYGGHPFMVEAAIGYGGKLPAEGSAQLMRFANRVPLIYQQGGCATTRAVADVNWRAYGLAQAGLPQGPILILVHVASTNVPFTSESKDAIAAIPEIEREVTLALQDLGRDLKSFVSRRDRTRLAEERARAVCAILPELAAKVAEVTERPLPDISPIEGQIMRKVVAKKRTVAGRVEIEVQNHTGRDLSLQVFEQSGDAAGGRGAGAGLLDRARRPRDPRLAGAARAGRLLARDVHGERERDDRPARRGRASESGGGPGCLETISTGGPGRSCSGSPRPGTTRCTAARCRRSRCRPGPSRTSSSTTSPRSGSTATRRACGRPTRPSPRSTCSRWPS
jgi:DNA topoisomerase VI subunit B